jgi:hypothetical protein
LHQVRSFHFNAFRTNAARTSLIDRNGGSCLNPQARASSSKEVGKLALKTRTRVLSFCFTALPDQP